MEYGECGGRGEKIVQGHQTAEMVFGGAGVSCFHQGKSFGSKMINDCLVPFIRRNGGGILALITNTNLNRSFYKKNGFDEFSAFPLKRFGREIGNWSFKRTIY